MRSSSLRIVARKRRLPPRLSYIALLSADARAVRDSERILVSSSLPALDQLAEIDVYNNEPRPPHAAPSIAKVRGRKFQHRLSMISKRASKKAAKRVAYQPPSHSLHGPRRRRCKDDPALSRQDSDSLSSVCDSTYSHISPSTSDSTYLTPQIPSPIRATLAGYEVTADAGRPGQAETRILEAASRFLLSMRGRPRHQQLLGDARFPDPCPCGSLDATGRVGCSIRIMPCQWAMYDLVPPSARSCRPTEGARKKRGYRSAVS